LKVLEKNPTWVKDANSKKLITNAWTVNDEKSMDWLVTEGIDLITTNEPELLLKKVRKK
jgi:glycerophosphoryl diester phosphodiesterase